MIQKVVRPDVEETTMPVRFCYCACRYGFAREQLSATQQLQPLPTLEDVAGHFSDELDMLSMREEESLP
jgi:hypothetical protein